MPCIKRPTLCCTLWSVIYKATCCMIKADCCRITKNTSCWRFFHTVLHNGITVPKGCGCLNAACLSFFPSVDPVVSLSLLFLHRTPNPTIADLPLQWRKNFGLQLELAQGPLCYTATKQTTCQISVFHAELDECFLFLHRQSLPFSTNQINCNDKDSWRTEQNAKRCLGVHLTASVFTVCSATMLSLV